MKMMLHKGSFPQGDKFFLKFFWGGQTEINMQLSSHHRLSPHLSRSFGIPWCSNDLADALPAHMAFQPVVKRRKTVAAVGLAAGACRKCLSCAALAV